MTSIVKAALQVLGLRELPKTKKELKRVYRGHIKRTHPDLHSNSESHNATRRLILAHDILSTAISERDKPKVFVRFGDGDMKQAFVFPNPAYKVSAESADSKCEYMTRIKWFYGLTIRVEKSAWIEIDQPKCVVQCGVLIFCL